MEENKVAECIEKKKWQLLPFLVFLLLLSGGLLGIVCIYSARIMENSPMHFVIRQLWHLGIGGIFFLAASLVPFRYYRKNALLLSALSALMLVLVLFCGCTINGMRGWFVLPCNIYFQPSEFAKVFFLLALTVFASKKKKLEKGRFFLMLSYTFLFMFLLMKEPDFGSVIVFFGAFLIVTGAKEGSLKALFTALFTLLASGIYFIFRYDYAFMRILAFLNPAGDGVRSWHIRQFQYTLAHGGFAGSEQGTALWARSYLPLPHTDSLFASIVELTGFMGSMLVILIFSGLGIVFTLIAWKTKGESGRLYVFSAGMLCFFQALLHISVNCVMLPATGVTLPMLSYGGSSLISVMLSFGIALSAAKENSPDDPVQSEEEHTGKIKE